MSALLVPNPNAHLPGLFCLLVVGKEIQQAKKFPMNAPGRGHGMAS